MRSFEWCSKGPINTIGFWSSGIISDIFHFSSKSCGRVRLSTSAIFLIAAVDPDPQNKTISFFSSPPTELYKII